MSFGQKLAENPKRLRQHRLFGSSKDLYEKVAINFIIRVFRFTLANAKLMACHTVLESRPGPQAWPPITSGLTAGPIENGITFWPSLKAFLMQRT